jgi:NIMA (never in mitosis gene a)-related kinase
VLYESVTLKPPFRAEDMQGLYKKVLRGIYPKIPSIFSNELSQIIKLMV